MFYSYLGITLLLMACIMAITTDTWNRFGPGLEKISVIGIITLFMALAGFFTSSITIYSVNEEVKYMEQKVGKLGVQVKEYEDELQEVRSNMAFATNRAVKEKPPVPKVSLEPVAPIAPSFYAHKTETVEELTSRDKEPRRLSMVAPLSGLNMRSGPGIDYSVIATLPVDTLLITQERMGDWLHVLAPGQKLNGWVAAEFVSAISEFSTE